MPSPEGARRLVAVIPWLLAAVVWLLFPRWTVDDAWIVVRHARHLAELGVATWNPGEAPVEGYTGHLLLGLLAAGLRLGLDPILVGRAVGALGFFGGGLLLDRALSRVEVPHPARIVAVSLYLLAPFQPTLAWAGLETSIFGACLLAVLACLAELAARPSSRLAVGFGWLALLATALARPEGWLLSLLGGAGLLALAGRRALLPGLLLFALPVLALHGARWRAYADLLPNTWHAKQLPGLASPRSLGRLADFASLAVLGPVLLLGAWGLERPRGAAARLALALRPLGLGLAITVLTLLGSHLSMPFGHRFFAPYLGLLLAAGALVARGPGTGRRAAALLLVPLALWWGSAGLTERHHARDYARVHAQEHARVVELLRPLPPHTRLAAVSDAGQVPARTGLPTLDFGGLNDRVLARRSTPIPAQLDHAFAWAPDVVVIASARADRVQRRQPRVQALADDPRFAGFEQVAAFSNDVWPDHHTLVYARGEALRALR